MLSTITARLTTKNDEYIKSITGGQGVIEEQTGELRSTFDILQDLAEAWPKLTSVEKQELTETVAGKTQRSLFTAIMENFETAVGATEAALNSENSAAEENEKRMDSLQGKVIQLQSAWQELAHHTVDSDLVKWFIDFARNIVELADSSFGKFIAVLAAARLGMIAFNKVIKTDTVIALGNSIKTVLSNALSPLIASFEVGVLQGGIFKGVLNAVAISVKGLGTALLTLLLNPLTLVIAAIGTFTIVSDKMKQSMEEASEGAQKLADKNLEEANSIETLLEKYEKLSSKTNKSTSETKKLQKIVETLSEKYGVSKEALQSEGEERDKTIKQLDEEIKKRKQAAALAQGSTLKVAGNWFTKWAFGADTTQEEKETFTSRDSVSFGGSVQTRGLSKEYDLEANTITELRQKVQGYIETLSNKNDKTKEEEKDLTRLNQIYNSMSQTIDKYENAYSQAYENLKEGIPITTEQGNALYQLGKITELDAKHIEQYNNYVAEHTELSEEDKDALWDRQEGFLSLDTQISDTTKEQEKLNKAMEQAQSAQEKYDSILNSGIQDLINYSDNVSLLTQAQDMLKESGHLTAEMYQQLANNNLLQYLDEVNGELVFNKDAFDNAAQATLTNASEALKNSAAQKILQLAIADQNGTLDETAQKLGLVTKNSDEVNTANAVEEILKINSAADITKTTLGDVFKTMEQGKEVTSDYTPSLQMEEYAKQVIDQTNAALKGLNAISLSASKTSDSSSKGTKKAQKSAREEYKATIDTLYKYKNALEIAKDNVDKINDSLSSTENYNEQEKYIRQLINAINDQINKTNDLKEAQTRQINDYINQLKAQGFAISYNAGKNELYIQNMEHLSKFTGDNAKNLEKMIDKIQDLNDNNRSLDGSVRDLVKDTKDYNKQLENLPTEKLAKFKELLESFQQGRLNQIQNQIEDLERQMKQDPRIKALEKQIEALEKQNDQLDKQKDIEDKLLAIEKAKESLANAQRQRNLLVYTQEGWQYQADPDVIKENAETLKEAQDDLNEQIRQDQIDQLQDEKDALEKSYQDRIDALQNFLDEQNYQIDKANREGIQTFQELQKEMAKFGLDNAQYLSQATTWLNNYNSALMNLNKSVNGILSSSTTAQDGLIYSSATQSRINQALSNIIPIDMSTGLKLNQIDYEKSVDKDGSSIYINNIELPNVRDAEDFVEALKNLPRIATGKATKRQ